MNEMMVHFLSSHPSLAFILFLLIIIILDMCIFISGACLIRKANVKNQEQTQNTIRDIFIGIISGAIAAYLVSIKDLISFSEIFSLGFWINLLTALTAICVLIFSIGVATGVIDLLSRKKDD